MFTQTDRITEVVKSYDRDLYCIDSNGVKQIYRKTKRYDYYNVDGQTLSVCREQPQFILSLTEDWDLKGKPVEWGIEPLLNHLREMDSWTKERDYHYNLVTENRDRQEREKERQTKNDLYARALDMRRDFARLQMT